MVPGAWIRIGGACNSAGVLGHEPEVSVMVPGVPGYEPGV